MKKAGEMGHFLKLWKIPPFSKVSSSPPFTPGLQHQTGPGAETDDPQISDVNLNIETVDSTFYNCYIRCFVLRPVQCPQTKEYK